MTRNLKFFLIAFLISFSFFFGINLFGRNLEDFFFWQEISKNPQLFTAQLNIKQFGQIEKTPEPLQKEEVENFQIKAEAAISVWLDSGMGQEKILFEKDYNPPKDGSSRFAGSSRVPTALPQERAPERVLPIASLTKLMTAYVVLEYYPDLSQTIEISREAVFQPGDFGNLKIGEKLSIENLLYITLIESSNDSAYALAEVIGQEGFVELMNLEAKYLGMENTHFVDSMGISPENRSSARNLVILTKKLLEKPLVWEILEKPEFDLRLPDGVFHHKLINTNEVLQEWDGGLEIVGGKTGYTPEAKGCFLLVLKVPEKGYLINVILGSEDRFGEMKKMINF